MSARAHVCAREITSTLAACELGGEIGQGEPSVELVRGVSELQKCLNLGTAAPRAAPRRPTDDERAVSEERGGCRKPGQNLRVQSDANRGPARSRDSFRVSSSFPTRCSAGQIPCGSYEAQLPGSETWAMRPCVLALDTISVAS